MYMSCSREGRYYMHEVVEGAASGATERIQDVRKRTDAREVSVGQWHTAEGQSRDVTLMTNSEEIARRIEEVKDIIKDRYDKGDEGWDRYGREGERAILTGLVKDMQRSGRIGRDGGGRCAMPVEAGPGAKYHDDQFWDNLSGQWLDPGMVRQARKEEMEHFKKHGVYSTVPIQE